MDGLPAVRVVCGPAPAGGAEVGDHWEAASGYGVRVGVLRRGHAVGAVPDFDAHEFVARCERSIKITV